MILDDLFEQNPLPAHIKPSDLPPAMRSRLTMRDVERERPRGAYRYRVIPGTPGESPKDFLDLAGAEQYAQAVKGRVQPLEEQADDPDVQRGMANLNAIEKQMNTTAKVMWQNETGQPAFQIELPVDKQWMISHAQEWIDAGRSKDLYKYMGTKAGQEFLLSAWQKEDNLRNKRARDVRPEEPDLFGASQVGSPKSPRYQDESQNGQKKRTEVVEAPQGARGRTERMMAQMRARQPQATSDLEALAYELQDAEQRDAQEIDKLEKEVSGLETDIKSDLQKRIDTLTRRRGGIRQAAASDTKIDATLDQLARVNDQQQRDIDTLSKAVASLGQSQPSAAAGPMVSAPTATAGAKPKPTAAPVVQIPTDQPSLPKSTEKKTPKPEPATPTTVAATDKDSDDIEPSATANSNVIDATSRFRVPQDQRMVANMEEGLLDTLGRAVTGRAGPSPFRDLTAAEKMSNQRAQYGQQSRALGYSGVAKAQQAAVGNIAAGEKQKVQQQLQALSQQIRQAQAAGAITKMRELQNQFKVLQTRGSLLKSEIPKTTPAVGQQTMSPGAFGSMVGQLTGTPGAAPAASPLAVPASTAAASTQQPVTVASPTVNPAWRMGQPIKIGSQTLTPKDPNYNAIASRLTQQIKEQGLEEKKKPAPTNPDLWSRAKSAARSKFDVYPSAYANAWAAKWYKSKGGGWRMGKPKKK